MLSQFIVECEGNRLSFSTDDYQMQFDSNGNLKEIVFRYVYKAQAHIVFWNTVHKTEMPVSIKIDATYFDRMFLCQSYYRTTCDFQLKFKHCPPIVKPINPLTIEPYRLVTQARVPSIETPEVPENAVDMIAKRHGLSRRAGESDGDLQARIKYVTG